MAEQKSKGQELAEYFNKKLKEAGLPEVQIVKPDRPRVWVTFHPKGTLRSDIINQSKLDESKEKEDL